MNTDKRSRDLTRTFPDDPDRLSLLHDRLAATAQQDRILDIAYRTIDSPVGPLPLAATEPGLIRVAYAREDHDAALQALADKISPLPVVLPCHRVVHSHGSMGGYPGGTDAKRTLLTPEA